MDIANSGINAALRIESGGDMTEVQRAVRAFAAPLGYDRFVLFSVRGAVEDLVDRVYWVEGDWFGGNEPIDAKSYVRRCPVTRHIVDVRRPFFWTKTTGDADDYYRVVLTPSGPGTHGVQVPVFGPLGLEGAMSLGGERIDASASLRMVLPIVAAAAFFAARRLLEPEDPSTPTALSKREREILACTASGLRQGDIAAALNLSERTVENHLRRIRRRLGVATTAHAIRIAVRNGDLEGQPDFHP